MSNSKPKIYIAGHTGLVGSALVRAYSGREDVEVVVKAHADLDLMNQAAVGEFLSQVRPSHVFLAAGKVGGILANRDYPAEFLYDNLAMQANVIHACFQNKVTRLINFGSSCIYPRLASQPMTEDALLTSSLEPTNESYAIAKIAGLKMCQAYNRQYGTHYLTVMPTNLYGPNDNYDADNSHVLAALIQKFHRAKTNHQESVTVWGTGQVRREFLHVDDLAKAARLLMDLDSDSFIQLINPVDDPAASLVNIGCGQDLTIAELADMIQDIVGFKGSIQFDTTKPDGTPQKLLDVSKMKNLGWQPQVSLREGISQVIQDLF